MLLNVVFVLWMRDFGLTIRLSTVTCPKSNLLACYHTHTLIGMSGLHHSSLILRYYYPLILIILSFFWGGYSDTNPFDLLLLPLSQSLHHHSFLFTRVLKPICYPIVLAMMLTLYYIILPLSGVHILCNDESIHSLLALHPLLPLKHIRQNTTVRGKC